MLELALFVSHDRLRDLLSVIDALICGLLSMNRRIAFLCITCYERHLVVIDLFKVILLSELRTRKSIFRINYIDTLLSFSFDAILRLLVL